MTYTLLRDGVIQSIQGETVAQYGGRTGTRELSMLKMLYARAELLGESSSTDLASLAAIYGYGLAHDQLFHDGNLATALIAVELFLSLNGHRLVADDTTCFLGFSVVANGELSAEAFASWIRTHIAPVPQAA
ncbi:MAG: type II toxin-antitoxin system death-on-curing family toxin [Asticcacaulis sp.]